MVSKKYTVGNVVLIGEVIPHYDLKKRDYLNEFNVLKKELVDNQITLILRKRDAFIGRAVVINEGVTNCYEFTSDEFINHIEDVKSALKIDVAYVYFFSFLVNLKAENKKEDLLKNFNNEKDNLNEES